MKIFTKKISSEGQKREEGGYALLIALIFFLTATTAVIAGISDAVFREVRTIRNESLSKQAYFTSESALEDAAYRIKNNKVIGAIESLTLATSTALVTITTEDDGSQTVTSASDASGTKRTTKLVLDKGAGIAFNYALQGGVGGIDMEGGSSIIGDIYTTGSIRGCGSCTITGQATAAGKSSSDLDQDNSLPETPAQSIIFGNANGTQDVAQSFTVSSALSLIKIELYIKKTGNPANATIRVTTNNAGSPSNTVLASGTLSSSLVGSAYEWINITLTANPLLSPGTTYWIVVDGSSNASNFYTIGANSTYLGGQAKVGRYGNSWNNTVPSGLDAYFKAYLGMNEEGITGEAEFNTLDVGSAYAYNASYVTATGTLYCQIGLQNNKACDTSRGDPEIINNPVPDFYADKWKDEAVAGGTQTGNVTVGSTGATMGPQKIVGNLLVSGGGTLRVAGTLWVTGTVTINGGSIVRPANSTGSYTIITDSSITLEGGSDILGGPGNHILLMSTSSADPAITIQGGANDTVTFAPNGGVQIRGGATVKAGAAKHLNILGGAQVIYDPDYASLNFPGGAADTFTIKSWKETE